MNIVLDTKPDDNKFVDCAIIANAKYIVTQDHHFDVLKNIEFPKVDVVNIQTFLNDLKKNRIILYQPCQRSQGSSLRLPLSGGINKKSPRKSEEEPASF